MQLEGLQGSMELLQGSVDQLQGSVEGLEGAYMYVHQILYCKDYTGQIIQRLHIHVIQN